MSKQSGGKTKELKIITRPVITIEDIKKDERKLKLLYVIAETGGLSEKALKYLIYYMKEAGYDLGYDFIMLGQTPSSRELHNDLVSLLYVGLTETNPRKKIVLTSQGKEFLEQHVLPKLSEEEKEQIKKLVEELRVKVTPIDTEVELSLRRPRRRRRLF